MNTRRTDEKSLGDGEGGDLQRMLTMSTATERRNREGFRNCGCCALRYLILVRVQFHIEARHDDFAIVLFLVRTVYVNLTDRLVILHDL